MNIDMIEQILLKCDTPPSNIINYLSNYYEGFNLLTLYETLYYYNKLSDELPYAKLYKKLSDEERFVVFPAIIGVNALMDPSIQEKLLQGKCSPEILGSLSALNEYYETLKDPTSSNDEKTKIIDALVDSECPLKLIPSSMLEDYDFISSFCKHNWDFESDNLYTKILKSTKYSRELEKSLLESLNVSSMEEYLRKKFEKEEYNRDSTQNIDITQIVVSKLYTLKLLSQNKTTIKEYSHNPYTEEVLDKNKTYGYYNSDRDLIALFPFMINTLKDLVIDSSHEAYHAIQKRNIQLGDIKKDSDVDVYSMDQYLKEILGVQYYKDNYEYIGSEYDAEIKAQIDVSKLSGPDAQEDELSSLMAQVEKLSQEKKKTLDILMTSSPYTFLLSRIDCDGNRYHLFRLFEKVVNEQLENAEDFETFRDDLISRFPIFKYMLNIYPDGISIKKPEDYIKDLETANREEFEIYLHLISNNLHPIKYPKREEIRTRYLEAIRDSKLPKIKKTGVFICIESSTNKYEKHFMSNRGV